MCAIVGDRHFAAFFTGNSKPSRQEIAPYRACSHRPGSVFPKTRIMARAWTQQGARHHLLSRRSFLSSFNPHLYLAWGKVSVVCIAHTCFSLHHSLSVMSIQSLRRSLNEPTTGASRYGTAIRFPRSISMLECLTQSAEAPNCD
jgi:hypothetical protein